MLTAKLFNKLAKQTNLSAANQHIAKRFLVDGETLNDLAKQHKMSKQRVAAIKNRVLAELDKSDDPAAEVRKFLARVNAPADTKEAVMRTLKRGRGSDYLS